MVWMLWFVMAWMVMARNGLDVMARDGLGPGWLLCVGTSNSVREQPLMCGFGAAA